MLAFKGKVHETPARLSADRPLAAAAASARPVPETDPPRLGGSRLIGGLIDPAAKAEVDTLILMGPHGSGAPTIGSFETPGGTPDWNGWTSIDYTTDNNLLWHVSTFHAVNGTYSAWCGDPALPSCGQAWDEVGGYPNNSPSTSSGCARWRTTASPAP